MKTILMIAVLFIGLSTVSCSDDSAEIVLTDTLENKAPSGGGDGEECKGEECG